MTYVYAITAFVSFLVFFYGVAIGSLGLAMAATFVFIYGVGAASMTVEGNDK